MAWLTPEVVGAIMSLVALILGALYRNRVGESDAQRAISRYSVLRQAAFDAVLRAEQEFGKGAKGMTNEELKSAAVETAQVLLRTTGMRVTQADLLTLANLIEAAVRTLKAQGVLGDSRPVVYTDELGTLTAHEA